MDKNSVQAGFSIDLAIAGAFSWNGNTFNFKPNAALTREVTYLVTINTSAKDLAGNPLQNTFTCSFTTATFKPAPPTGLKTSVSENKVSLLWNDNSDNEDGFIIKLGILDDYVGTEYDRVGQNITEYLISGLKPTTKYNVIIFAYNSYGKSTGIVKSVYTESVIDTLYVQKDVTLFSYQDFTGTSTGSWHYENEQTVNNVGHHAVQLSQIQARNIRYHLVIYFGYLRSEVSLPGGTVKNAYLEFYVNKTPGNDFYIYKSELVSSTWSENSVTLANAPNYYTNNNFYSSTVIQGNRCRIGMKNSVQTVLDNVRDHGGFLLRADLQYYESNRFYSFATSENPDPTKRPKLIIEFE